MMIGKKFLSRRTVLRGIGTALALPLLDSMVPALKAFEKTAAKPTKRFGAIYVPNGIMMENWTPEAEGKAFDFTPILRPLEPFRDHLLVLSGLNHNPPPNPDPTDTHPKASTRFLTDVAPRPTRGEADLHAGISMDQIAAKELGRYTQLSSLELGLESSESAGTCSAGFSCAYTNTISWRTPTTPLPMEHDPRVVFERMFGEGGSTDATARRNRMQEDSSILDSVIQKISQLERGLGPGDRAKLTEYFEAIRDVERRIQNAEKQNSELPKMEHPAGVPDRFEEYAKLMYDLIALAYQCDMTRIITFMVGREQSGRTFPNLGIPDAHHAISHHQKDPVKLAKLVKINTYHLTFFAGLLEKLRSTPDGDGSLLDHVMIIYGSGMSDGNAHDPRNLPILLAGGGCGEIKGGRHIRYGKDTPLANLHLTLLDKLGVRVDGIGDSTGEFNQLSSI
jgi:Protein of unknown function (DUF1552)